MLSNWLSKGAQVINNSAKSMIQSANPSNSPTNMDPNMLTRQILTKIQNKLQKQLGQSFQLPIQPTKPDATKQSQLQKTLIQTKQKYNTLISQTQLQNQSIKQMLQYIVQLLKNISNSLQNDDMLTPIKQLQNTFYLCNTNKVQKILKLLYKLYEVGLEDYVKDKINIKINQHKDQITLFKNLNKNLQVQLFRSRNNYTDLQKRMNQIYTKNQQLSEKLSILQKLGAQNLAISINKDKQKFNERENQLLDKIKILEKQKNRLQRTNKAMQSQIIKNNDAMTLLKNNQQCMFQDMKREMSKKQSHYQSSISKICNQKIQLQQKIRQLIQQLTTFKQQNLQLKTKQIHHKPQVKTVDVKQLNQKLIQLQQNIRIADKRIQSMVSKEMMKNLFISFQDQSKQWTIRKDIKNQIYLLLDIKAKKNQTKIQDKKWFGIF